jgi:hypothetical protein
MPSHEDEHPAWVLPFWVVLALVGTFLLGCVCGAFLMWLSLGPLGPAN